jgi:hypothetical protein
MTNLTSFDDFLNENIAHAFMLMKTLNITYVKYIQSKSKRRGIKDTVCHIAFYKGFVVSHSSIMRDFIINVLKFVRNYKSKTERYIEQCLYEVRKIYPAAAIQYYSTPTAGQLEERLWQTRHIHSFNRRDSVSLCIIIFSYDNYMGYVDIKLKAFKEPDNILKARDVEDQFYKDKEYNIGDIKNLKSTLDSILPIQIQEWTEKIEKNFSEINNCPEHILKHIHTDKTIKWKKIGLFED